VTDSLAEAMFDDFAAAHFRASNCADGRGV
jgi:hypothetical protein